MIGTEGLVQYCKINEHLTVKLDYLDLAKQLYCSSRTFDLFQYLLNGHSLTVRYLWGENQLFFTHIDNSKPRYYKEIEIVGTPDPIYGEFEQTVVVVNKEFKEKVKRKFIDYPTYEKTTNNRMVATSFNMFAVFEYEEIKGTTHTEPNYERATRAIKEVVEDFRKNNTTQADLEEMKATQKIIEENNKY